MNRCFGKCGAWTKANWISPSRIPIRLRRRSCGRCSGALATRCCTPDRSACCGGSLAIPRSSEAGRRPCTTTSSPSPTPGPTDTELFGQGKTEEQKQQFARMAALGRLGQPQDIADVVALLVSNEARWITGQNVRANGGLI